MSKELQDRTVVQPIPTLDTQTAVTLHTEEVETLIAPKVILNHNESVLATRLDAEEVRRGQDRSKIREKFVRVAEMLAAIKGS